MSKKVHYKGVLKPIKKLEGETLEDQCRRLSNITELPSYYESYEEYLRYESDRKMIIHKGVVYQAEVEIVDQDGDIFRAHINNNNEIEYEVRYYNGGCGFNEAIEEAINRIK